jgi:hypothetical protein
MKVTVLPWLIMMVWHNNEEAFKSWKREHKQGIAIAQKYSWKLFIAFVTLFLAWAVLASVSFCIIEGAMHHMCHTGVVVFSEMFRAWYAANKNTLFG